MYGFQISQHIGQEQTIRATYSFLCLDYSIVHVHPEGKKPFSDPSAMQLEFSSIGIEFSSGLLTYLSVLHDIKLVTSTFSSKNGVLVQKYNTYMVYE